MSLPEPGDQVNLRVQAAFNHYPGIPNGSRNRVSRRGKNKPSLELLLEAAPMFLQLHLPKDPNPVIQAGGQALSKFSWNGGIRFSTILDTGASRSLIGSGDVLRAFGSALDRNKLPEEKVSFANGTSLAGARVWMFVQIVPEARPFLMPFIVSPARDVPVLISWRSIRKMFRFVLAHDHMCLCDS